MLNVTRKLTDVLVTALFIMLVVVVFIQVLCRVMGISFPYADEMSRYTFVWLIYLGGTITIRKGMNITFVTTAQTDEEGYELLKEFGLPFKNAKN